MQKSKPASLARTFICSVVFVDIVGYSKKTVAGQLAQKGWFNGILSEALQGVAEDDRIVIDTGDGAAICLLGDPEDAVFVTNALRVAIAEHAYPDFTLRMGVNLGPVRMAKDVNGRSNILGDGINVAQRVMSFAAPNQILVSRSYFDIVSRISDEYERLFRYHGEHKDKHVRAHQVYEVLVEGRDEIQTAGEEAAGDATPEVPPAGALDQAAVEAVGLCLTRYVGPIAPLLARKTARRAGSMPQLVALLADSIPVPEQRNQFVRETGVHTGGADEPEESRSQATAPEPPATVLDLDDDALGHSEKLLARYIGPMASVIVRRALKGARDRGELLQALAASIDDEAERARFEAESLNIFQRGTPKAS